ncbi:MAG: nucleoside-diphosphate kinase [Candidatus Rokubacteria bacterium]|nr:nucleoside-diphosphate kinase [Candidatus Rokubacteria bacterium]
MAVERTLVIVKPDAVRKGVAGRIIGRFEAAGFRILAMRMVHLTLPQAEGFYAVHRARPFFASLTKFMSEGPCIPMVLEGEDAIVRVRDLMGATNPAQAAPGTIRNELAESIEANAVHGSDSLEAAAFEIPYFFPGVG